MRILILGYSGFLGKHFLKIANESSADMLLIGRRKPDLPFGLHSNWIESEIKDLSGQLKKVSKVDAVVNLVWHGLPKRDDLTNRFNFHQQLAIYNALENVKFDKLLCAGSSLEYEQSLEVINEEGKTDKGSNFAVTKMKLYLEARQRFTCVLWPRIFFSYGSGQHSNSLLNHAYNSLTTSGFCNLQNPDSLNDFVHASDVARAFLELLKGSDTNGIYNVGSGIAIRNIVMAEILQKFFQEPSKYQLEQQDLVNGNNLSRVNVKTSANDNLVKPTRVANIQKIISATKWRPKVDLEEGIHEFLRFRSL